MNKKCNFLVLLLMLGMLFGLPGSMFAQKHVVTGTVVDQNGEPMVAVTVMEKGTSNGTITNFDGVFSLSVANNATLSVSFVGFKTQETSTTGKSNLRIVLREDNEQLDEIVVVGYGTMKKSDLTGAITRVGEKELQSRPVNNAFEALQGKAAGVDITTNERPGQIGSIRIRGERSLNGGNTPLYVVDGVPLMSASGIETLNPRDIESIDILKDASATAIYGSRGANGVVIVTTKQGQSGKMSIDYTGTLTVSNIIDRSPSMSAADFIQFSRWAKHNADPSAYADPMKPTQAEDAALFGETASLDPTFYNNVMSGWSGNTWDASKVKNTNWTDYVTQTALSQEHTLAVSGGTEKMKAYASFGYLNNKGTQKGQWYERYTGKVNVNIQPTKWFTLQASINGTWSEMDYGMSTFQGRSGSVPDAIYGTAKTIFN
ncbi:MAG: SusC/RagA family TonB-linked outer membrane protein, partial [Bacteroidaceae bacterium]|nr:SusC/RagA family TonB-linked outer membrane protein [Bacteroidaceae bacterium]